MQVPPPMRELVAVPSWAAFWAFHDSDDGAGNDWLFWLHGGFVRLLDEVEDVGVVEVFHL